MRDFLIPIFMSTFFSSVKPAWLASVYLHMVVACILYVVGIVAVKTWHAVRKGGMFVRLFLAGVWLFLCASFFLAFMFQSFIAQKNGLGNSTPFQLFGLALYALSSLPIFLPMWKAGFFKTKNA